MRRAHAESPCGDPVPSLFSEGGDSRQRPFPISAIGKLPHFKRLWLVLAVPMPLHNVVGAPVSTWGTCVYLGLLCPENPWHQLDSKDAYPTYLDTHLWSKGEERTTINLYCPGDQTNRADMDTAPFSQAGWCFCI